MEALPGPQKMETLPQGHPSLDTQRRDQLEKRADRVISNVSIHHVEVEMVKGALMARTGRAATEVIGEATEVTIAAQDLVKVAIAMVATENHLVPSDLWPTHSQKQEAPDLVATK